MSLSELLEKEGVNRQASSFPTSLRELRSKITPKDLVSNAARKRMTLRLLPASESAPTREMKALSDQIDSEAQKIQGKISKGLKEAGVWAHVPRLAMVAVLLGKEREATGDPVAFSKDKMVARIVDGSDFGGRNPWPWVQVKGKEAGYTLHQRNPTMSRHPLDKGGKMKGYIAFYKGKKMEVKAISALSAREIAAEKFRARKPYDVEVVLAEKGGKQVTHMPMFASEETPMTLAHILDSEGLRTADTSGGKYLVRNIEKATNLKFTGAEDTGYEGDGEFGGEGAVYRFENESGDIVEVYYEAAFDEGEEIDQESYSADMDGRFKEFNSERDLMRALKKVAKTAARPRPEFTVQGYKGFTDQIRDLDVLHTEAMELKAEIDSAVGPLLERKGKLDKEMKKIHSTIKADYKDSLDKIGKITIDRKTQLVEAQAELSVVARKGTLNQVNAKLLEAVIAEYGDEVAAFIQTTQAALQDSNKTMAISFKGFEIERKADVKAASEKSAGLADLLSKFQDYLRKSWKRVVAVAKNALGMVESASGKVEKAHGNLEKALAQVERGGRMAASPSLKWDLGIAKLLPQHSIDPNGGRKRKTPVMSFGTRGNEDAWALGDSGEGMFILPRLVGGEYKRVLVQDLIDQGLARPDAEVGPDGERSIKRWVGQEEVEEVYLKRILRYLKSEGFQIVGVGDTQLDGEDMVKVVVKMNRMASDRTAAIRGDLVTEVPIGSGRRDVWKKNLDERSAIEFVNSYVEEHGDPTDHDMHVFLVTPAGEYRLKDPGGTRPRFEKARMASDRTTLIRMASELPKGSDERRAILAGLKVAADPRKISKALLKKMEDSQAGPGSHGWSVDSKYERDLEKAVAALVKEGMDFDKKTMDALIFTEVDASDLPAHNRKFKGLKNLFRALQNVWEG